MWILNRSVAVFINDKYIGSDIDFINYVNEIYVICLPNNSDFYENLIANDLKRIIESSRKFIFFTFNINGVTIGSFLFMVNYNYLKKKEKTYDEFIIHNIKNYSYILIYCLKLVNIFSIFVLTMKKICSMNKKSIIKIQPSIELLKVDGFRWVVNKATFISTCEKKFFCKNFLTDIGIHKSTETITTPDESYCIAHDRCGVLSLSNNGNHHNGPQFIVCLNPNPWMDGNYLAFG